MLRTGLLRSLVNKSPYSKGDNTGVGLMPSDQPFASKKSIQVNGKKMAYIDVGKGDSIVFQHGNPTSSYLWRNIMPYCEGLGRLIACDLIGMGDSDKLPESNAGRYSYSEQREYLFAAWVQLDLGDRIIFVIHDWGSALAFEWVSKHDQRVQGIVYMEAIVDVLTWDDWPENARKVFQAFRSPDGEEMILDKNVFVERVLPGSISRTLSDSEMAEYRRPFQNSGEERRPTLSWPRQIPIEGEPAEVVNVVRDYSRWLRSSQVPKLFINADPGSILVGRQRDLCRHWPNQTEVTVSGLHFLQEDSPEEIGAHISSFVQRIRFQ